MPELGVVPNTVVYNTLMNGYVKGREVGQANMLYNEMRNNSVAPDGVTFNILISGHYNYGREEDGDWLLRDLSVSGVLPDCSLTDVSVSGLCWAGRVDEATEFLQDMLEKGLPISIIAFNSIIAAYSKVGLEQKAFEAYNIMLKFGRTPSSFTCTSLVLGPIENG